MFTVAEARRSDKLRITLDVTEEVFLHCDFQRKDFIVKRVVVRFESGKLIHAEAVGPVRRKDGGEHARLEGKHDILGSVWNDSAMDLADLPDWASDLPQVLATDPTCTAHLSRYWSEKSPEDLAGDPIYVAYR